MQLPAPGEQEAGTTRELLVADDGSVVRRTVLGNGIRVLTESVPAVRSVALGMWIGVGSRDEVLGSHGASHFLEHLLFKGTGRRSAFEISAEIEAVGGDLNAFTSKECTCFHARVLADDLAIAADVIADMVTGATLAEEDFQSERRVVLEELAMREDEPADFVQELFSAAIFGQSPLGRPVIGTAEELCAIELAAIIDHYRLHYVPEALVVTAAGAADHDELVRLVAGATAAWGGSPPREPLAARATIDEPCAVVPGLPRAVARRPTEQANVVLGVMGVSRLDPRRWPLAVLDVALGGGMSSRLFQEVREKRGLAYAIRTFRSAHSDVGVFGVQAGTNPERAGETISVIKDVLREAAGSGLDVHEVVRAKGQLRGATVLDAEDTSSRMCRLGDAEVLSGEFLGVSDVIGRIESVTAQDVSEVAAEILGGNQTLAAVGPFVSDDPFAEIGAQ